jgi:hypothetical protein
VILFSVCQVLSTTAPRNSDGSLHTRTRKHALVEIIDDAGRQPDSAFTRPTVSLQVALVVILHAITCGKRKSAFSYAFKWRDTQALASDNTIHRMLIHFGVYYCDTSSRHMTIALKQA